jgi:hypothetical protein
VSYPRKVEKAEATYGSAIRRDRDKAIECLKIVMVSLNDACKEIGAIV